MSEINHFNEEQWSSLMKYGYRGENSRRLRRIFGRIPSHPRCKNCHVPFGGIGGATFHMLGWRRFEKNPNFCRKCVFEGVGGVEIEISMLFADVRGSTTMAEKMSPTEFKQRMNRFYLASTDVLVRTNAWLDKLVGDEIIGLYIPGYAGAEHARLAVQAAQDILCATGHGDADGPWIPVGAGVHTGNVYLGMVGAEGGVSDLTALGDAMNTAARLASQAKTGEVLVSEATRSSAGLEMHAAERRQLQLKGRAEPVVVSVLGCPPST